MTPPAHFLAAWLAANCGGSNRRDRAIITAAGILPDIDGIGYPIDWLAEKLGYATHIYDYHHIFCHNVGFALLTGIAAFLAATKRWKTALLALGGFHLHMLMEPGRLTRAAGRSMGDSLPAALLSGLEPGPFLAVAAGLLAEQSHRRRAACCGGRPGVGPRLLAL